MNKPEPIQNVPPELEYLDRATRWLDTRFRIPGTDIRFGFDALLGLIPGAGDAISLLVSGGLVIVMARHGSSFGLLVKMLFNILLDALLGIIPFAGDVFDVFYKANRKNLRLLVEHYESGGARSNLFALILLLFVVVLLLFGMVLFLIWRMFQLLFS